MQGMHLASKQSIIDLYISSYDSVFSFLAGGGQEDESTLFLMEKLMKLVSTRTWYGGPSCVLYWKKRAVGT